MAVRIGDVLGDYKILDVLGRGGMGEVFRVRNVFSDRLEAMKVVLPSASTEDASERFLGEIRLLATLNHPAICRLLTAFRAQEQICMVMELAEGVPLTSKLRDGAVDVQRAIYWFVQILGALVYAHGRGIIHRDLKPDNIIISLDDVAKLTDFGIARAAGVSKLTSTGIALGTLYYVSPEQVKYGLSDERSDLYSMGITMYETITGRRPIEGDTEFTIMTAQVNQIPVPPIELNPDLPAALSQLLMKLLAKSPEERFQTAANVMAALQEIARCLEPIERKGSRPESPRQGRSQQWIAGKERGAEEKSSHDPSLAPGDLEYLERMLAAYVGPIARIMVAKGADRHRESDALYTELAQHINDIGQRERFLAQCRTRFEIARSVDPITGSRVKGERPRLDPSVLQQEKELLAEFVGPMASLLVEKAAETERTENGLIERLAGYIALKSDRERYLSLVTRKKQSS
jgi:eukaryotic-like serine/threonine-protein kinase